MDRRTTWVTAVATIVVLGGCGDGGSDPAPTPFVPGNGGSGVGDTRAGLRPVGDRESFFEELRGALVAQRGNDGAFHPGGVTTGDAEADLDAAPSPSSGAPGEPAPTDPTATPDAAESAGGDDTRLEVTETNVQERGVDEQDRVKVSSDGSRLYVLQHGFGGVYPTEPFLVDDVESGDTVEIEPGVLPIDGRPDGVPRFTTTLRVLGLDAASADATPLRDIELDLGGRNADGMYLHESDAGSRVLLTSSGGGYCGWICWEDSFAFGGLDSVVTRIDVDEPSSAEVTGSFRIDGQLISSRRIGKYLFFASRFYPTLPGVQPYDVSPEAWRAAVSAADDDSLLPGYTDEASGTRVALIEPASCFVAERPASGWYSPDIVTLAVIDLDTMKLSDSECYLGSSETLYASPDAVYLATTRYDQGGVIIVDGPVPVDSPVSVPAPGTPTDGFDAIDLPVIVDPDGEPAPDVDPVSEPDFIPEPTIDPVDFAPREQTVETDIHQFDIDGGSLVYRGSGSVRGHLGFDLLRKPFRMSARDGFLRVATVNDAFGFDGGREDVSPINVTVLEPDGEGALVRVAELPNADEPAFIGKPGERLYASRFIGDRAYLVTFRQIDPLYVVDLADPRNPSVLGALEIDGYSDHLMPIGNDHLLGIGRDAVAAPGGDDRGAIVLGLKLSLFDVSDPANPREADTVLVGQRGTQSEALFDHRGITVQHATDKYPTRISFGIDIAGEAFPTERPDPDSPVGLAYYDWSYTGLHGFDVTGGDGAGIEPRGAMIVERRGQDGQLYGPSAYGDRSVMVNDATYYVHGDKVYAATWDTLANPSGPR